MPRPDDLARPCPDTLREDRWIGRVLGGRFSIVGLLGRGGMASVYEAENTTTRRRVALKILEPSARLSKEHERRFLREARAAACIRHPNVVAVHDIEVDRITSALFMVQELLAGDDLRAILRAPPDGQLSLEETLAHLVPIGEALEAAHQLGVVHCDVTPGNVFIAVEHGARVPKLIDFGVAQRLDRAARAHVILGTPHYMAPEQARGEAVTPRSDVWSYGAVLYRCLTGRVPFEARTPTELLLAIDSDGYVPVHERVELPLEIASAIDRALEPDPTRRFASMTSMLRALRDERGHARAPAAAALSRSGSGRIARLGWAPRRRASTPPATPVSTAVVPSVRRVGRLRFGAVLVGRETAELRALDEVARAVEPHLALRPFDGYARLLDALAEGSVDLAWLPPLAYVRARRAGAARQVLCVQRDARRAYASALVVRSDSETTDARTLSGKRAAWVSPWSAAGHLVPRRMLRSVGIDPDADFDAQTFCGSHEAVLRAVLEGSADVGATALRILEDGTMASALDPRLRVLAVSADGIPGDTVCISTTFGSLDSRGASDVVNRFLARVQHRDLQPSLKKLLGSERFVAANPSRYDQLEAALVEDLALASPLRD